MEFHYAYLPKEAYPELDLYFLLKEVFLSWLNKQMFRFFPFILIVFGDQFLVWRGEFFKKVPLSFPYTLSVRVGEPIQANKVGIEEIQRKVLELGRLSPLTRDCLKQKWLKKNCSIPLI